MQKNTVYAFLILFISLLFWDIAQAGFGNVFGGTIIKPKAQSIERLEQQGYTCIVVGTTIQIKPQKVGMPKEYFIPALTMSKTRTTAHSGQKIIGKYQGKTTVSCTRIEPPSEETVNLDTITIWGTSKK